jgi:hypothetical protein
MSLSGLQPRFVLDGRCFTSEKEIALENAVASRRRPVRVLPRCNGVRGFAFLLRQVERKLGAEFMKK